MVVAQSLVQDHTSDYIENLFLPEAASANLHLDAEADSGFCE